MSQSNATPAIEVKDLKHGFLKAKGVWAILLQVSLFRWICTLLGCCKQEMETETVLNGLSFSVPRGSIFGIFGVNAAGKSTLLRAITGFEPPDSGTVLIHGKDAAVLGEKAIARVVSHDNRQLCSFLDVLQNIEAAARLHGLDPEAAVANLRSILLELGVKPEHLELDPSELSLGTRGKVALVHALLPILSEDASSEGPILFLDEPTLGFDVVAVEQFFQALRTIKEAISDLTIVLATNDPREMSFCQDFIALVHGQVQHDEVHFQELKASVVGFNLAISAAAAVIGRKAETPNSESSSKAFEVKRIPRGKQPPAAGIDWRHWNDIRQNMMGMILVSLSLFLPNLLPLFASERQVLDKWLLCSLGVFATLMVRESYRFLDREKHYFNMLEKILTSPISRLEHVFHTARCSILTQLGIAAAFFVLLGAMYWSSGDLNPQVLKNGATTAFKNTAGLCFVVLGIITLSYAAGMLTALVPFVFRGKVAAYFFVSLVPMLVLMFGSVMNEANRLPAGLSLLAEANPLSHAAAATADFLGFKREHTLRLTGAVLELCPGLSRGWANIISMFTLGLPALVISCLIYMKVEPLLRKAGRLRN